MRGYKLTLGDHLNTDDWAGILFLDYRVCFRVSIDWDLSWKQFLNV